jgi:hypothetical protein
MQTGEGRLRIRSLGMYPLRLQELISEGRSETGTDRAGAAELVAEEGARSAASDVSAETRVGDVSLATGDGPAASLRSFVLTNNRFASEACPHGRRLSARGPRRVPADLPRLPLQAS